jgi:hypothetical protein
MSTTNSAATINAATMKKNKVRLNAAFADLRRQGILAKQNYACCQTCGFAELRYEAKLVARQGREVLGGIFYDMQDADDLKKDGKCCLAYVGLGLYPDASAGAQDDATLRVGRIACETLRRRGVSVVWDGSAESWIRIDLTV